MEVTSILHLSDTSTCRHSRLKHNPTWVPRRYTWKGTSSIHGGGDQEVLNKDHVPDVLPASKVALISSSSSVKSVKTDLWLYRARRVKCNEAKPACKRCSGFGRKCEGYVTPDTLNIPRRKEVAQAFKAPVEAAPLGSIVPKEDLLGAQVKTRLSNHSSSIPFRALLNTLP